MKKTTRFILSLAFVFLSNTYVWSQNALLPAGGNASNTSGSVSYSIGQVVYNADSSSGGKVSEGVQQAYEIFTVGGIENLNIQLVCTAYPNPTTNILTLEITNKEITNLRFEVIDASGKLLLQEKIFANETQIRLGVFAEGVYFLKIYDVNTPVKSFKVIKNQ